MKNPKLLALACMTVISALSLAAQADIAKDPNYPRVVSVTGKDAKQLLEILDADESATMHRSHMGGADAGIMIENVTVGNVECARYIKVDPSAKDPKRLEGRVTCSISLETEQN